jgi:hypothetical protein
MCSTEPHSGGHTSQIRRLRRPSQRSSAWECLSTPTATTLPQFRLSSLRSTQSSWEGRPSDSGTLLRTNGRILSVPLVWPLKPTELANKVLSPINGLGCALNFPADDLVFWACGMLEITLTNTHHWPSRPTSARSPTQNENVVTPASSPNANEGRCYRPLNTGLRFSLNASTPSRRSSVSTSRL